MTITRTEEDQGSDRYNDPSIRYSDLAARDTENLLLSFLDEPEDQGNPWAGALCSETDPEAFFPEKGESSQEAKKICISGCPIREFCLEFALKNNEQYGIWGGLSTSERKRLVERWQGTRAA